MTECWNHTRVASTLGVRYPIIQGAMGGLRTQRLTAVVSNFGGLGSFGAHGLEPAEIADVVAEIRTMTSMPFAMNLWVSTEDASAAASDREAFARALSHISPYLDSIGGSRPSFEPHRRIDFELQVRALIDARVPVFSFLYGVPAPDIVDELRRNGIVTLGTATTPDEATVLEQAGIDMVVASGFEAGGHRGSFLRAAEDSLVGGISLVPQTVDRVTIPIVAAGGIADARGIAAAFMLGAEGVQLGTAFLVCEESGAPALHREMILSGNAPHTSLTRGFTGRLARGLNNQVLKDLNKPGTDILPYPLQRRLIQNLARAAQQASRPDLLALWAGQSANLSHIQDPAALLRSLVAGASALLDHAGGIGTA